VSVCVCLCVFVRMAIMLAVARTHHDTLCCGVGVRGG